MSGPWENYQPQTPAPAQPVGPWTKYQKQAPAQAEGPWTKYQKKAPQPVASRTPKLDDWVRQYHGQMAEAGHTDKSIDELLPADTHARDAAFDVFKKAKGTTRFDTGGRGLMGEYSDEIVGALETPGEMARQWWNDEDVSVSKAYNKHADYERLTSDVTDEHGGAIHYADKIAGGFAIPSLGAATGYKIAGDALAKYTPKMGGLLQAGLRHLSAGVTGGAVFGAIDGSGDQEGGRLNNAVTGSASAAMMGGPLGVLAPMAVHGLRGLSRTGGNVLGLRNQTNAAADTMLEPIKWDRRGLKEISQVARQNPDAGFLGAGVPTLSARVSQAGKEYAPAGQKLQDAMDTYGRGAAGRSSTAVRGALDVPPGTDFGRAQQGLKELSKRQSDEGYGAISQNPVELTPETMSILAASRHLGLDKAARTSAAVRSELAGVPQQNSHLELWSRPADDGTGRVIQETPLQTFADIQTGISSRLDKDAFDGSEMEAALDIRKATDNLLPELKAVRDIHANNKLNEEALVEGTWLFNRDQNAYATGSFYDALDPRGRKAMRLGAAHGLEQQSAVKNAGDTVRSNLESPHTLKQLTAVGVPQDRGQGFQRFVGREEQGLKELSRASNVSEGSGTSYMQNAGGAFRRFAYMNPQGGAIAAASDIATHGWDKAVTGLTDEGRKIMADLSTSGNIKGVEDILAARLSQEDKIKLVSNMIGLGIGQAGVVFGQQD